MNDNVSFKKVSFDSFSMIMSVIHEVEEEIQAKKTYVEMIEAASNDGWFRSVVPELGACVAPYVELYDYASWLVLARFLFNLKACGGILGKLNIFKIQLGRGAADSRADCLVWHDSQGADKPFSVAQVWNDIRTRDSQVEWYPVVWFASCIPRHAFNLWLVVRRKLKTQDLVSIWDVLNYLGSLCSLCELQPDSYDHLFFECPFAIEVRDRVKGYAGLDSSNPNIYDIISDLIPIARRRLMLSIVAKALGAALKPIYYWKSGIGDYSRRASETPIRYIMDTSDAHPMNIDEESDDSVEEIGNPTQSEGVASISRPKKGKENLLQIYSAESSSGTGNLKRHLEKCLKSTTRDIGQYMISSNKGVLDTRNAKFSQDKFRELLVHAVVRHDLPYSFTEYEGVRDVFNYLEPDVTHITRNTTKADMLKLHGVDMGLKVEKICDSFKLVKELESPDEYLRKIAKQMWLKFNKYWSDFNLLLAVAVVFDPRYKYSFLEFSYAKLYGKDSEQLAKLVANELSSDEEMKELSSILKKSQQYGYPVLAKLAMDILCVPILRCFCVAFSLGGRILDQYRSSMKPSNVEALICTRDWLFIEKAMSHADLEKVTKNIMALDINKDKE
ncbi:reverse transcriptase domain, reverse transcriptase zinc-binding domain protein [Tanacetum coccineum]